MMPTYMPDCAEDKDIYIKRERAEKKDIVVMSQCLPSICLGDYLCYSAMNDYIVLNY